jgi:hypothetical protein
LEAIELLASLAVYRLSSSEIKPQKRKMRFDVVFLTVVIPAAYNSCFLWMHF